MGIYTNGILYGIRIAKWVNDEAIILFERINNTTISRETLDEAKLFYDALDDKNNMLFQAYYECSNTYGNEIYKTWMIVSLDTLVGIKKT